ncbi:MAG TPA: 16S rRNA (guanine(966)-N(2))-methyltransferase RsmD [Candidatus Dormibacteraeota bacterium]
MSHRQAPSVHLRVSAGDVGGRRLDAPRGIRPTQSLVREAIYDIVGPLVADAVVIDLFAGSGALGIEALSRGAAEATFIDQDERAVRVIRRNLESLGLPERGRAVRADVGRWLRASPDEVGRASLVLLDPPYNDAVLEQTLALLDALVAHGASVVAEHAHRQPLPSLGRLRTVRERRYGDTAVSVLVVE